MGAGATLCALVALGISAPAAAASPEAFNYAVGYDVVNNGDTCTTLCQYGRSGTGSGQLAGPLLASASGNQVFVGELDITDFDTPPSPRMSVFDVAAGKFVRALGRDVNGPNTFACTTSCGPARPSATSLNVPGGSALAAGELFVADRQRVAVLDPTTGVLKRAFGRNVGGAGVNLCTTNCVGFGNLGAAAGELSGPAAVAVSGGHVFVLESTNSRVSVFTTAGAFEYAFGKDVKIGGGDFCTVATGGCKAGAPGGGAGRLSSPAAIAISGDGTKLFISETEAGNERVSVFNPTTGAFIRAFGRNVGGPGDDLCLAAETCFPGTQGTGVGQFAGTRGLSVSGNQLAVGETFNNRVSVFNTDTLDPVRAIGKNVGGPGTTVCTGICTAGDAGDTPSLASPSGVALAGGKLAITQNTVIAADFLSFDFAHRLLVFDAQTGKFERGFGKSVRPGGNGEKERCTAACEAGLAGGKAGQLNAPQGTAVSGGQVFVADTANNRVTVFNTVSGAFVRAFGKDVGGTGVDVCTSSCAAGGAGFEAGELDGPVGVAVSGGQVFVADNDNNRVAAFNVATGAFTRAYGKNVGGPGTTTCTGICQAGVVGSGAGELDEPVGVTVAGSEVLVSERDNNRVSAFNVSTGAFARTFGKDVGGAGVNVCAGGCQAGAGGSGAGRIDEPSGISASGGQVFVGERRNRRVSVFTAATGAFVRAIGKNVGGSGTGVCSSTCNAGGGGPGTGRLDVPVAVAVAGGELFVGESNNNRVSVFNPTTGAFLRAFGKNVGGSGANSCTSSCQAGRDGYAAGQLDGPFGVAVGGSFVYVGDSRNNRLAVYSTDRAAPTTTDDVPATSPTAPVTVTLTATDAGGAGVARTYYTKGVNPAAPTTASSVYSAAAKPALAKGERIRYFSTDNAGNAEPEHGSRVVTLPPAVPKAKLKVARITLATALRKGILVRVSGAKPGRLSLVARKGRTKVAAGKGNVARNGTAKIRLKFTRSAKRSLRKAKKVKLKISGGGGSLTITLRKGK
jgi:DNA-binding beta-propeller fold protein YncE